MRIKFEYRRAEKMVFIYLLIFSSLVNQISSIISTLHYFEF